MLHLQDIITTIQFDYIITMIFFNVFNYNSLLQLEYTIRNPKFQNIFIQKT